MNLLSDLPAQVIFADVREIIYNLDYTKDALICITDSNIVKLSKFKILIKSLQVHHNIHIEVIAAGEASKNYDNKIKIEHNLLSLGYRKNITILAVGGGVVLDLAGFIAANYCRGVEWIACPTSLMAIVDVGVGGKTGINTKYGKNTLGAIYPSYLTIVDITWLETLAIVEYRWALTEIVKMAAIYDVGFIDFLLANSLNLCIYKFSDELIYMLKMAVIIKSKLVAKDLYDSGQRRYLNFGHTLAHAIEINSNWQVTHGQAVSVGLKFAAILSLEYGFNLNEYNLLLKLLEVLNCNFVINNMSADKLWNLCHLDKKVTNGNINWVVLSSFGKPLLVNNIDQKLFNNSLIKLIDLNQRSQGLCIDL